MYLFSYGANTNNKHLQKLINYRYVTNGILKNHKLVFNHLGVYGNIQKSHNNNMVGTIMEIDEENLEILRKIYKHPNSSQRELAKDLGFSLGKLNYCIKALQQKGLVKIKNFQSQNDKVSYIRYMLTPKGISLRTKLTIDFMKRKMKEYDELKSEL